MKVLSPITSLVFYLILLFAPMDDHCEMLQRSGIYLKIKPKWSTIGTHNRVTGWPGINNVLSIW